jgi:hypothetical protein
MFKWQYEVFENGSEYTLCIYDAHGRRHFMTGIDEENYGLYEKNSDKFVQWIEETFDDVLEVIS